MDYKSMLEIEEKIYPNNFKKRLRNKRIKNEGRLAVAFEELEAKLRESRKKIFEEAGL